ncbi:MAG TPA: hypothetical protein VFU93_06425 [Acidimicrobiales bacterium]|nr:hypothetical protein [Acidimicrobiales bacterium]
MLDRLEAVLRACPDDRWATPCWEVKPTDAWMPKGRSVEELQVYSAFWATAAHALFFLDTYLDDGTTGWNPANPHFDAGLDDRMQALLPDPPIGRDELLAALSDGRAKAQRVLPAITAEQAALRMPDWHPHPGEPFDELVRGNLDHLREHTDHLEAVVRA